MDENRLHILLEKYLSNKINSSELQEFYTLLGDVDENEFSAMVDNFVDISVYQDFDKESLFQRKIKASLMPQKASKGRFKRLFESNPVLQIAASILILSSISLYIYINYNKAKVSKSEYNDVSGEEIVSIKLADGKQISLDSNLTDTIHYKGLAIHRLDDGTITLASDVGTVKDFGPAENHQFISKLGSVLKLRLQDGSLVELNSGSKLELSVAYGVDNRSVKLTGEAYFDVEHNAKMPFRVNLKDAHVKVLGTSFNISAYEQDNNIVTTLIKGSVEISSQLAKTKIKPGEQAVIHNKNLQVIPNADISTILSWREGYFKFKDKSIEEILHELSKWYEIREIVIPSKNTDRLTGSIKRTKNLVDVLQNIEEVSNLKFKINEGRVIVMK